MCERDVVIKGSVGRNIYFDFNEKRIHPADKRPNEKMTDEQLDSLSPWNENVKQICQNNS